MVEAILGATRADLGGIVNGPIVVQNLRQWLVAPPLPKCAPQGRRVSLSTNNRVARSHWALHSRVAPNGSGLLCGDASVSAVQVCWVVGRGTEVFRWHSGQCQCGSAEHLHQFEATAS